MIAITRAELFLVSVELRAITLRPLVAIHGLQAVCDHFALARSTVERWFDVADRNPPGVGP